MQRAMQSVVGPSPPRAAHFCSGCRCFFVAIHVLVHKHAEILVMHTYVFFYRDVCGICGFSKETLIAVTTDIESRELKRVVNMEEGLPAEHPRASTTDDLLAC